MSNLSITRTPETVGAEIRNLTNQAKALTLWYGVEIGRRLQEAKSMVQHGEWGEWVKRETEFSQSTATRFMKLFDEYGADQIGLFGAEVNSSTLQNMSISNALRLLAVPESEREAFAEAVDAENLSARELEKAIAERDAAKKAVEEKEAYISETLDKLDALEEKAKQAAVDAETETKNRREAVSKYMEASDRAKELEKQLEELKNRPVEVAVETVTDQAAIDAAVQAAKEAAEKERATLQKKLDKAKADADAAKLNAANAETARMEADARAEELRKKLATADSDVAIFKTYFTEIQETFNRAAGVITKIKTRDEAMAGKLREFAQAAIKKMGEAI